MVAPGINGYTKDLDKRPALLKPEEAKKMLADAGYPNGFEVGMDCPNDRYVNDEKICQAVVAMLARIGVKVNLQGADPQPLLRQDPAQERPVAGRDQLLHARLVAGPDLRRAQRLRGADPDAEQGDQEGPVQRRRLLQPRARQARRRHGAGDRQGQARRHDRRGDQALCRRLRLHPAAPAGAGVGGAQEHRPGPAGRQLVPAALRER